MRTRSGLLVACFTLAFAQNALSQTAATGAYPSKPIRIIVPFAAGGPTDTHARWAGQQITAALGQQVIVDNRGGAGGISAPNYSRPWPASR